MEGTSTRTFECDIRRCAGVRPVHNWRTNLPHFFLSSAGFRGFSEGGKEPKAVPWRESSEALPSSSTRTRYEDQECQEEAGSRLTDMVFPREERSVHVAGEQCRNKLAPGHSR